MIERTAARVLLLDTTARVLLFRGHDPRTPETGYWFTVGGGLDDGEDARAAAARELREETGLSIDPAQLVGPVHHDVTEFPFDGEWYRQTQDWFALRVDPERWQFDTSGFEPIEREMVETWRWWSAEELRTTDDAWYPAELVDLVERVNSHPGLSVSWTGE